MTWAHWLVLLLFLIGIAVGESLRNQERTAANKEDNNGHRNTYRSGYIPSRNQPAAHPGHAKNSASRGRQPEAARIRKPADYHRHTTEKK